MDSTVDAMAAAYDALVDAAAAAVREKGRPAALEDLNRCVEAFRETCDRAEGLVQAAAAGIGPPQAAASTFDALCRTVQAIEQDLQAGANAGDGKEEVQEEKAPAPSPPVAPVAVPVNDK